MRLKFSCEASKHKDTILNSHTQQIIVINDHQTKFKSQANHTLHGFENWKHKTFTYHLCCHRHYFLYWWCMLFQWPLNNLQNSNGPLEKECSRLQQNQWKSLTNSLVKMFWNHLNLDPWSLCHEPLIWPTYTRDLTTLVSCSYINLPNLHVVKFTKLKL